MAKGKGKGKKKTSMQGKTAYAPASIAKGIPLTGGGKKK